MPVRLRQLCDELEELRSGQANRKAVGGGLRCGGSGARTIGASISSAIASSVRRVIEFPDYFRPIP